MYDEMEKRMICKSNSINKKITEEREISIAGNYDVIVAGAGVAGVSAALAAARLGSKVLIVEKSVMPGGLATLGLIAIYLPLCDGNGRKLIGGISEELLLDSIKYGYDNLPDEWRQNTGEIKNTRKRYQTQFSPPEFILAMEEKLIAEGIDIIYDTIFSDVIIKDKKCTGIIVENKSGRSVYSCKMTVDATGDSDVMNRAGAACVEQTNRLSFWWYETNLDAMKKAADTGDVMQGIKLRSTDESGFNKNAPGNSQRFIGTDGKEVSDYIIKSRHMVLERLKKRDRKKESFLTFPGMAQLRTTRRIDGLYTLTENDEGSAFDDSVGCAGDWRKAGPVYEVPYRALISKDVENVIAAGRNISSAGDAWEVTRVIPVAAMTGEAAGTAASMACSDGVSLQELNSEKLQNELKSNGILIHIKKDKI